MELAAKDATLVPPMDVEVVWLAALIRTRAYAKFCVDRFGELVDHTMRPVCEYLSTHRLKATREAWAHHFEADMNDWTSAATVYASAGSDSLGLDGWSVDTLVDAVLADQAWLPILEARYGSREFFHRRSVLDLCVARYAKFLVATALHPDHGTFACIRGSGLLV